MLDKCEFHNVDATHTFALNDVKSPLNLFEVTIDERSDTSRNKVQLQGINPTKHYLGGMEIHCEGVLFDDDSGAYMTLRQSLILALRGSPSVPVNPNIRKDGTLIIRLTGTSEDWIVDCEVNMFSAPLKGNYPALTEYAITFKAYTPWFVGASSGSYYYWS